MGMEWPKEDKKTDFSYVLDELKVRYIADGPDFVYPSSFYEDLTPDEQNTVLVMFEEVKKTL